MDKKSMMIFGGILLITNVVTASIVSNRVSPPAAAQTGAAVSAPAVMRQPSPNLPNLFNQLLASSQTWGSMTVDDRVLSIEMMMKLFKDRENVAILKTADFYAGKITEALAGNPAMQPLPLPSVLKIVSVMEYDYFNGQDKDALAKEVLGEQLYAANKARLAGAPPPHP